MKGRRGRRSAARSSLRRDVHGLGDQVALSMRIKEGLSVKMVRGSAKAASKCKPKTDLQPRLVFGLLPEPSPSHWFHTVARLVLCSSSEGDVLPISVGFGEGCILGVRPLELLLVEENSKWAGGEGWRRTFEGEDLTGGLD